MCRGVCNDRSACRRGHRVGRCGDHGALRLISREGAHAGGKLARPSTTTARNILVHAELSCDVFSVKKKLTDFVELKRVGSKQEHNQGQRGEDLIHAGKVLVLRKEFDDIRQVLTPSVSLHGTGSHAVKVTMSPTMQMLAYPVSTW